jgi:hypothetical protein
MMNEEGAFARLLELIQALRREEMDGGAGLHRLLMDLLYEMSRIQRVKIEDLGGYPNWRAHAAWLETSEVDMTLFWAGSSRGRRLYSVLV